MECQMIISLSLTLIGTVLASLKKIVGEGKLINFLANRSKLSSFMLSKGVVDGWFERIGFLLIIIGILWSIFIYIDL